MADTATFAAVWDKALKRALLECEAVIDWSREKKENPGVELGALRCRDAIRALLKDK